MNGPTNSNETSIHSGSHLRPRHLLVVLLLAAIGLVELLALAAALFADASFPDPASVLLIGLGLGNMGLAGFYLALGRQSLFVRCLVATVIALAGGILAAVGEGNAYDQAPIWCGVALFNAFLISVPIVYLWARGLRVIHLDDGPEKPPSPRRKFSLWGAMTALTCAAILLAIARNLRFPIDSVGVVMMIALVSGVIVFAAAGTLLGPLKVLTSLACIGVAAFACVVPLTLTGPALGLWEALLLTLVQGALAAAVMLTLRTAGYRMRWPVYEHPVVKEPTSRTTAPPADSAVAAIKQP